MIHIAGLVLAVVMVSGDTWISLPKRGERRAATFRFRAARVDCVLDAGGNGSCGEWQFVAVVPSGDFITRAYALRQDGQLLVAYEFTNDETGGAAVVAFSELNRRAVWRAEINEFNLGVPAVRGRHAYVTAAGFVAKLDLSSGEFEWKQDELMARYKRFEWFSRPIVKASSVIFREEKPQAFEHGGRWAVEVADESGEIIHAGDVRTGR